jgi:hypothetical protein
MPVAAPKKRKAVVRSGPRRNPPVNVLAACQKVFRPAKSFAELVAIVRDAERRLAVAGTSAAEERVSMLRGLYYGTPWSNDFA